MNAAMQRQSDKPQYRVPSMAEINAIEPNGFKVVSTFSGCGGSCLGYRMAGFKVIWANEFVPAAQDSYKANAALDCILDKRDIRVVQPEEILNATGLAKGECDVFDGSPPCQAFSTAGKREKGWGKNKTYEHGAKQKNEQLFTEYIRLLRGLMPKVFIAENVSGLVKGTAKGFFLHILKELKASGYKVEAQLLDAQWLGVPQMRQRIIFIGVRNDLELAPAFPKPLPYRYSVRDALPGIVSLTHDTSGLFSQGEVTDRPCPSITNGVNGLNSSHYKVIGRGRYDEPQDISNKPVEVEVAITGRIGTGYKRNDVDTATPMVAITATGHAQSQNEIGPEKRKFTIAELRRICAFPDDFILTGTYAQQWERLGNSVPPVMMAAIAGIVRDEILSKTV